MVDVQFSIPRHEAPISLWRRVREEPQLLIPVYLLVCGILGGSLGGVWALVANRPGYVVREDLRAVMSERGLAEVFAADALYIGLAAGLGLAAGIVAWLLARGLGWWVCVLAITGATVGGLAIWRVGLLVLPGSFQERLANATSGAVVPIDLELHSLAALLVAPFAAITPVMLFAALWPVDDSESVAAEYPSEPAAEEK